MEVVCADCGHVHKFIVDVSDFSGFVCVNCHSYFKGTTLATLTFVKKFEVPKILQWAKLNESIQFKRMNYRIITKILRLTTTGAYGNEYVGLNNGNKNPIYLADGVDYTSVLHAISKKKVIVTPDSVCKFERGNYDLTYTDRQRVIYAEGFVFEDLDTESTVKTYIRTIDEDRFISEEFIDDDIEYYQGSYIDEKSYFSLFDFYKDYKFTSDLVGRKFEKLGVILVLLIASIFLALNFKQIGSDVYTFDETFKVKKASSEFIGTSFELKGEVSKTLLLEGISEAKNYPLFLEIKLVNEKTNAVIQTNSFVHEDNDINYARGLTVDFCRVEPGIYHLVFVTSLSNASRDMALDVELSEDYKLTYGGTSYLLFISFLVGAIILLWVYRYWSSELKNKDFFIRLDHVNLFSILKFRGLAFVLFIFVATFIVITVLVNSSTSCKTTISTNTLEDHTYTGSRGHYYRSYYDEDGSGHK